ncbi:MAG: hypothetical protein OEV78_05450 [Spirochaetia bacterium]|nr:hypothetical protein [Spirochaetia bacterium]
MDLIDFHLYLVFVSEKYFFAINIKNIKKLYRMHEKNVTIGRPAEDIHETNRLLNIDFKKTVFLPDSKDNEFNKSYYFPLKIPTFIELLSPEIEFNSTPAIVVDLVIGMYQIPPDEFNSNLSINNLQIQSQLNTLNLDFLDGHCLLPVTGKLNQTTETPVYIVSIEKLLSHGVKST